MRSSATIRGVARAFGGALLFAVPILLTMEMWSSAATIARWRPALLVAGDVALVMGLSRCFGLIRRSGATWPRALVDAGVALLVGFVTAAVTLRALGVIHPLTHGSEAVSVVALEALPAAVGASFARAQLGEGGDDSLLVAGLEVALIHAFVYNLGLRGGSTADRFWPTFDAYSVPGYACALGVSAYLL